MQRGFQTGQLGVDSVFFRIRQRINRRQAERTQNRPVGGQDRRNGWGIADARPGDAAVFERHNIAALGCDAEEFQADARVRIDEFPHQPRPGVRDADAQFFTQFACQRVVIGFARFDLAAQKFPVARIDLA